MARSFSTNLKGKVRNFPLPKNRPLVPLYEAIVNSINAIDERKKTDSTVKGIIDIEVLRENSLFAQSDENNVIGFRIIDNGIGFNEDNMKSFMEADSDYKLAIGGKGVGRFSWLKVFSIATITSTFKKDATFVTRSFDFTLDNQSIIENITNANSANYVTEVCLKGFINDYDNNVPKQLNTIAARIIQHCFAYFLRGDCPQICIFDEDARISLNQMFAEGVNTDDNQTRFNIGKQKFELLNIRITDRTFAKKNRLFLCANERLVYSRDLESLIPDLDSSIFEKEGYWYIGVLSGEYLDNNVDMNRLSFNIPLESSPLLADDPGLEQIETVACSKITEYLKVYLNGVEAEKQERIQRYTTEIAPQYRHLPHYVPEKIAALKPGISNAALDDALYGIKRDFDNKTKAECKELIKKLDSGVITTEEYQEQFQKTIGKVSDVNRAALADYVVHRRIILDLFNKGLFIRPDGKFNQERYMHQLIYPMRSSSIDMPYENHNLWLLDEKLSFCQFISSDKPFDNKPNEERTDILMLDSPVVVADDKNQGTAFNSIIIFELKKPQRDDYNMINNPMNQLVEYVKRIKNGEVKDSNHREIRVTENTQFYLYALCDITPTLDSILDNLSYTRTPDKLGAYFYNNSLHAYIEVLSYDKVKNDAEKRNRILFEKLGV